MPPLSRLSIWLEEDLTITIELISAKEAILCTGETNAIYKISDINLQYDGIFDTSHYISEGFQPHIPR